MGTALLALLVALAPAIAELIKLYVARSSAKGQENADVVQHSIDELESGRDRLRPPPAV